MNSPGIVTVCKRTAGGYEVTCATLWNGYRMRVVKTRQTADQARKAAWTAIQKMIRQAQPEEKV